MAWWQSTSSLSGISVKSLLHQLISNSIITLYLWREGSSLLVLVPQAANTLLYVWKMAKASGVTFSFRYYLIPVIGYNARLHASAVKGKGSSADEEAVHYMTLLLTPFLAGFALYSFVHHKYTGWGEFALTTAVSAVYGAGFALMCPQLYINWKVRRPPCVDNGQEFSFFIAFPADWHPSSASCRVRFFRRPSAAQVGCAHAVEGAGLPLLQHRRGRPLRLHHQDAAVSTQKTETAQSAVTNFSCNNLHRTVVCFLYPFLFPLLQDAPGVRVPR